MQDEYNFLKENNYINNEIKSEIFKVASMIEYTDNKLYTLKYNSDNELKEEAHELAKRLSTFFYNYRYQLIDAQRLIKSEEKKEDQTISEALKELEEKKQIGFIKLENKTQTKARIELLTALRLINDSNNQNELVEALQAIDMSILNASQIEQIQTAREAASERIRKNEALKAKIAADLKAKHEAEEKRILNRLSKLFNSVLNAI